MSRVSIEVVGDTISARTALTKLLTTTEELGTVYNTEFAKMKASTLALQVAQGNLAVSTARYSAGSLGAARATLTYQRQVDALRASQMAAMTGVGRALTRYVTAPTLLAAAAAVKLGTDFQSHMLLIQTQAGASADEVKQLSGQVLKLASSGAQQGPVKLADGLYHLESVGLRGADAMRALAVASNAAAVGMASIEDVATALGGAVTSNIRGAQDYQQAMGTLNATIGAGNMRMEDLIGALGTGVLPAAKNAGLSLTEVGAALAVLTDRGMQADMAGTRLRMTFALMQNPSKKAVTALADMGVNANSMAATLRKPDGLLKVLQMLHDGMQSVGAVRGSKDILGAFGGGRSGAGILTLIQSLDSAVSSYQGKVAQIRDTSGQLATSEAAQQKLATANFHRDLAKMEADLVHLGDAMLPTVAALADGATEIAGAFGKLPGPVKHDLGAIVAVLAVSGPLLLAIVGVKRMIRSIGTEFGLMPAEAAPGIAATGAELETGIGGAATAAEVQVSTLRASLASIASIGTILVTIKVLEDFIPHKLTKTGQQLLDQNGVGPLGKIPIIGPALTAGAAEGKDFGKLIGLSYKDQAGYTEGSPQDKAYQAGLNDKPIPIAQLMDSKIAAAYKAGRDAGKHPIGTGKPLAPTTSHSTPNTGTAKAVPLTAQQKLADELIAHPNDVRLLAQQASNDKSVIAWAERMRNSGRMDNVRFQQIYKQYMGDLVATEATITSLTTKAAHARTSEASKRVRAAEESYRAVIAEAKAAVDRAKLTRGTIKDDEVALQHLLSVYRGEAHDTVLPTAVRATASQNAAATQGKLSSLRDQYTVPLALQLEAAKAQATNDMGSMLDAARKTKAAALKAIHSGVLSMQGMIAAWNVIDQANQQLGSGIAVTSYKTANVIKMTAGLGLSAAARREMEMRAAQAMSHGGRVPTGPAALGQPLGQPAGSGAAITIPITVEIDGRTIFAVVKKHELRDRRSSAPQTRGRNAGRPR